MIHFSGLGHVLAWISHVGSCAWTVGVAFCDFLPGHRLCKRYQARNAGFFEPPHIAEAVFFSQSALCPG